MVPRTFPSVVNSITQRAELVALFLNSVTGLQRWVDYIPVNFGKGTTLVESSYDNNGFIAVKEITSGIGLVPFKDYVPIFFDASATDTWQVSSTGFIPYGSSGVLSAPSLDISFTRSTTLDPRITFTRSTTATFTGSNGLIQTAAIDAPRFDYDPVTLAPKGLLIEEQRINLVLNSAMLVTQSVTVAAVAHTLSFYGTGTVTISGTFVGSLVGTGAYPTRSTLTFTPTAGVITLTVTGSVTLAQLEAGAFATSYIPTVASQVTRAFDLAVMTGTNFSSWYNATEGTFVGTLSTAVNGNVGTQVRTLLCPHDGTANNLFYFGRGAVNNQIRAFASVAGAVQLGAAGITIANVFATNLATISMAYKTDSYAITGAGLTPTNATPPNLVPTVNQMTIGCFRNFTATSIINGHIQRITYYPLRLANAELQAATA